MLNDWEQNFPGRIESMFTALKNVVPSHLCDSELFDFKNINSNSGVINGGDTAFDAMEIENNSTETVKKYNNDLNIVEVK
jgi:tRNA 2-thiocytidine biosynthesis protein TtcA